MKILIVSLPRTGSTFLMNKISNERNLKPYFEPFDGSDRNPYNGEDNAVVKTIISHHHHNLKLAKQFDETILLDRRNLKELIESHSYQAYFSKNSGYHSNNPYVYKSPPIDFVDICRTDIIKWKSDMEILSANLNIPITYYEDIFDIKSKDRLRIYKNFSVI